MLGAIAGDIIGPVHEVSTHAYTHVNTTAGLQPFQKL